LLLFGARLVIIRIRKCDIHLRANHMLEYLTMLDQEPRPDLGIIPWSEWLDQNLSRSR
jgi:hypothetical protein